MAGAPALVSAAAIAEAPGVAMGMTYVANADSIGLVMENAAAAQQRGQVVAGVATTITVAMIIAAGAKGGA